jgi:site-specific DNA-methyltransferase (adenine-specific)
MRRMLKDTGSIYYHCDPTASHYIKIVLDYVFGIKNFRNEIVWCYAGGGASKVKFPQKHDTIFCYGKIDHQKFNGDDIRVPYDSNYKGTSFKSEGTRAEGKSYVANPLGKLPEDWWTGITRPYGQEILGYPTQKPEALLERIIKASSNEGDLVMDFYNGGGTTGAVCKKLNRNYLGVDINYRAIQISQERLTNLGCVLKKD